MMRATSWGIGVRLRMGASYEANSFRSALEHRIAHSRIRFGQQSNQIRAKPLHFVLLTRFSRLQNIQFIPLSKVKIVDFR